ncbi:MAG: TadE/TadG family type IV pilus assembly protein [Pseudomonadota bacterium]
MIAVEFAIALPVLVIFFLGAIEVTQAVWTRASVFEAASVSADLSTQFASIDEAAALTVLQAAERVTEPVGGAGQGLQLRITSLLACDCGNGSGDACFTVLWSHGYAGGALTPGYAQGQQLNTIPQALGQPFGGTLVFAEASLNYTSPFGFIIGETFTMSSDASFRPRNAREVVHTGQFATNSANICP